MPPETAGISAGTLDFIKRVSEMAHQSNKRGTLMIDRVFKGVGRIKRATGTKNKRLRDRIDDMLVNLYQDGRRDILRSIRDQRLTILQVWGHYRVGRLRDCPTLADVERLEARVGGRHQFKQHIRLHRSGGTQGQHQAETELVRLRVMS